MVLLAMVWSGSGAGATPTVKKVEKKPWGTAELGFQGAVVARGGDIAGTYLIPVFTLQGGHFGPLAGVVQFGVGAMIDEDLAGASRTGEATLFALGARFRPLELVRNRRSRLLDLYVGPLASVYGNHEMVVLVVGGELGLGLHFGRWRLSVQVHAGWADIMDQEQLGRLRANWSAGGQLSFGLQF